MDSEEEQRNIEAVYGYIKKEGPVSEDEIIAAKPGSLSGGMTWKEQVSRIVDGLSNAEKIYRTSDGWVTR